ncbi:MAG: hypothetical protein WDA10_10975 [Porticoccaceae bacterium]
MQRMPERRRGDKPVPDDLSPFLNAAQAKALPELEKKGVVLYAVRRPLFQKSVLIVKLLHAKERYGVLLEDGTVDYFPDIPIRDQSNMGIAFGHFAGEQAIE